MTWRCYGRWEPAIRATLSNLAELTDVNTDAQDKGLQTSLQLDRDAMARLGVSVRSVDATLNDAYGQRQIATLYEALNQYRVVMEADGKYLQDAESLKNIYVSRQRGQADSVIADRHCIADQHAVGG